MTVADSPWVGRVEPVTRTDISAAYWESDASAKELAERFGMSANQISRHAGPGRITGMVCRACGGEVVERARTLVVDRLKALSRTYGWSRSKNEAQACNACQQKERDEARLADMRRWSLKYSKSEADMAAQRHRENELAAMPYGEYLLTTEWRDRRQRALRRAGYACQVCFSSELLHVHHRTYANRGREQDADLTVLCADCHQLFHDRMQLAESREVAPKQESAA